jgi:HAD superfamily hydrolase (TIGR01493 family)
LKCYPLDPSSRIGPYGTLFDVQSVASAAESAFPGHGKAITQSGRLNQREDTWLRSFIGRYEDFSVVTRDTLRYTLRPTHDVNVFARMMDTYSHFELYDDARQALSDLKDQAGNAFERQHQHVDGARSQQRAGRNRGQCDQRRPEPCFQAKP